MENRNEILSELVEKLEKHNFEHTVSVVQESENCCDRVTYIKLGEVVGLLESMKS